MLRFAASTAAGSLLLLAGKLISIIQQAVGIESPPRALAPDEVRLLSGIFGESLALESLRVVEGRAGLFDLTPRCFTLGNTIYMKDRHAPATLVHEAVHAWQFQRRGPAYAAEALAAQWLHRVAGRSCYDWRERAVHRDCDWRDWNPEAQAQFVEDTYREDPASAPGRLRPLFANSDNPGPRSSD